MIDFNATHGPESRINPSAVRSVANAFAASGTPFWDAYSAIFGVSGHQTVKRDIDTARLANPLLKLQAY